MWHTRSTSRTSARRRPMTALPTSGLGVGSASGQARSACLDRRPFSGVSFCTEDENALALAASDACAYVYDIRQHSTPLQVTRVTRK